MNAAGGISTTSKELWPVLDLRVHRPIGRVDGRVSETGEMARLVRTRDQLTIVGQADQRLWSGSIHAPLVQSDIEVMHTVRSIDLGTTAAADEHHFEYSSRVAELAAAGPVLFSEERSGTDLSYLGPRLAAAISDATVPAPGTPTVLRSVRQRRAALWAHGGLFRLDRALRERERPSLLPAVSAVLVSKRPDRALVTLKSLAAQSYERLEVVLAMHGTSLPDLGTLSDEARAMISAAVEIDGAVSFGEALGRASSLASGDLVAKIDDDDLYSTEHVSDLVLAYLYSGANVVGKQPEFVYLEHKDRTLRRKFSSEAFVRAVAGGTIMISVADLHSVGGWRPVPRSVDRALLERVHESGGSVYAAHSPGFVYVRHADGHTWQVRTKRYLDTALEKWPGLHHELLDEPVAQESQ